MGQMFNAKVIELAGLEFFVKLCLIFLILLFLGWIILFITTMCTVTQILVKTTRMEVNLVLIRLLTNSRVGLFSLSGL